MKVINEYFNKDKKRYISINWKDILISNLVSDFEWLEYNLKRAKGIKITEDKDMILGAN